jgi:NADP-dependent 3-hydroxy acid dehydrogenase YdfG
MSERERANRGLSERPVTLVTGGASGIGAATTRRLLDLGHRVAATGRSGERLARLAAEHPDGELLTIAGDVTEYPDVSSAVNETVARFGRLDHVVANAGLSTHDTLADGDPDRWREMVLANVLGPAYLIRAALPALRESRGRIVLVGSVAGFRHAPGNLYSATKWAVTALAENTRLMVTGDGIGVTLVAPGRVDTPFWETLSGPRPPVMLTPERVADAIAWALTQPAGVDVNTLVVRPVGQTV